VALAPVPVAVVALEAVIPLVVADRRLGDAGEPPEAGVVPAPEVLGGAGLVHVAEVEEQVRLAAADESGHAVGAHTRGGHVTGCPDDGALGLGWRRRPCERDCGG
jgi:hypothetical protein